MDEERVECVVGASVNVYTIDSRKNQYVGSGARDEGKF